MGTYAVVTKAPPERVCEAVRAGRVGGFVAPDPLGTIVLFDPPPGSRSSSRRLARPAAELVRRTAVPAWMLLANESLAEAMMLTTGSGPQSLQWAADWQPSEDPAEYLSDRKAWDAYCAEIAAGYGEPDRGADLALIRNDPVPGRPQPLMADLLRQVCRVFDLPDVAVGRSLLVGDEPGLYEAERVDGSSYGLLGRLLARS
ncbi:hypothetical protein BDK92_4343 [Micromonospora pisi]|uniref:Uncharacterized protein n=1 Tax=Micromonospora pisi TaxID=589240 RepID=A0A495JPJ4_9ACTN|nr:hypothetical protein [Micromonospora pisi]RKR89979.1 hypothetical protein BDK92_4343 [Micromonospora pisi]